jgi:two-component system chemotaxis response regulator CheB
VCVVLHIPSTGRSLLAPILDRAGPLPAVLARDGEPLRRGVVYVAPADHHLLVGAETLTLSQGAKEHGVRPAGDPLFRSLADSWGAAAVAVILSGALDDGAAGAVHVARAGGRVFVQDPGDALVASMPLSALAVSQPDAVLGAADIAAALAGLDAPILEGAG